MKMFYTRAKVWKHWGPRPWIVETLNLSNGWSVRKFVSWADAVEWLRREGW